MKISRLRALRGPNLWSRHTAMEAIIACSEKELNLAHNFPEFEARLRERFPEIALLQPLSEHIETLAHAMEFAALGLQAQAGCPVTFSRTTKTLEDGVFQVTVEYSEENVGRLAFDFAEKLCISAMQNTPFAIAEALNTLKNLDEETRFGPSTGSIIHAALARQIPVSRLTEGSLVQLGWGSAQRKIQAAEMDSTSAISEAIAQDKELTKKLLRAAGVPVPEGRPVENEEDAWIAAQEVFAQGGKSVVIKPQDGNQGKGVTVNLSEKAAIFAAYKTAAQFSDSVMLERYLEGQDHRILVVGDKLVAAARREPPMVIGDGKHTVKQLVDIVNADPRRGEGHATSLTKIKFDAIALAFLAENNLNEQSIPQKGARVVLRSNANLSTGGTATDVTDDVHPDFAARAVAAAQMIGVDIAGVDIICSNVLRPLEEQNGGSVEINAAPGLRMHLTPSYGKGRAVGEHIINAMFKEGENGRIPLVAVAGTNGKTTTVRAIAAILEANKYRVGFTSTDGVYFQGKRIDTGDCSGPKSAKNILAHPYVDAAVLETARGGVLREGLGFDKCDVAVVTNIGKGDHLGLSYINTVEDLAVVKRVIVQNVQAKTGTAVLNAADENVVNMGKFCPGKIIFFALDKNNSVLATHRAQGKAVVYFEEANIVCAEGKFTQKLPVLEIPITQNGIISFQIENAMAAIASAWALKLSWEVISAGLKGFVNDESTAPGRFNVFDFKGACVIADYGHNPDAISALVNAIEKMPFSGKKSVVISGAGDRRDNDIREQTQILGGAFDEVILYQDQCQRGRADGEVLALLQEGLKNAKRTKKVSEIHGEFLAIDQAFLGLQKGDLCLILVDQIDAAVAYIAERVKAV